MFSIGTITLGEAYALSIIKSYVFYRKESNEEKEKDSITKITEGLVYSIIINGSVIAFAWLASKLI